MSFQETTTSADIGNEISHGVQAQMPTCEIMGIRVENTLSDGMENNRKRGAEDTGDQNGDERRTRKTRSYPFSSEPTAPAVDEELMPWLAIRDTDEPRVFSLDELTKYIGWSQQSEIKDGGGRFNRWITDHLNAFISDKRKRLANIPNVSDAEFAKSQLLCELSQMTGPLEEIQKKAFDENARPRHSVGYGNNQLVRNEHREKLCIDRPKQSNIYDDDVRCLERIETVSQQIIKTWLEKKIQSYFPLWRDNGSLDIFLAAKVTLASDTIADVVNAMVYKLDIFEKGISVEQGGIGKFPEALYTSLLNLTTTVIRVVADTKNVDVHDVCTGAQSIGKVIGYKTNTSVEGSILEESKKLVEIATVTILSIVDYKVCKPAIQFVNNVLTEMVARQTVALTIEKRRIEVEINRAQLLLREQQMF